MPPPVEGEVEGGIELPWKIFAGEQTEVYAALVAMRWRDDMAKAPGMELGEYFRRHLHRGLNFLDAKLEVHEGQDLLPALVLARK